LRVVPSVETSIKETLRTDESLGRLTDAERAVLHCRGVLVEIQDPVGVVAGSDDHVDPQVVDSDHVPMIDDSDQVAVPPALLLGWEQDRLIDLEPIIEQYEAALLVRSIVEVKSPVVDDGVAKTQPRRAQLSVAHHGHRRRCTLGSISHTQQLRWSTTRRSTVFGTDQP